MSKSTILLVSADDSLRASVEESALGVPRAGVRIVASMDQAAAALADRRLALVLAHLVGPEDVDGIKALLRSLSAARRPVPTLVIGELGQAENGLALIRAGAADFLERPLNLRHFAFLLDVLSVRASRMAPEPPAAVPTAPVMAAGPEGGYLYAPTGQFGLIMEQVAQVAPVDTTILLQGETGTGKTRLAAVIHDLSPRRAAPFRVINCAALSPSVIESEMFGHMRGAFTGADRERIGRFAEVGEGTLVLDEVDALPLQTQAKLLRVIEDRVFEPVGANRPVPMRARLIAAANRDLGKLVAAGQFRADLYYRLNIVTFQLPALRERPAAVLDAMVDQFVREFADRAGRKIPGVTPDAQAALRAHTWPGNVRELRNTIERAVALRPSGLIELANLPDAVRVTAGDHRLEAGLAAGFPGGRAANNPDPVRTGPTLAEAKDAAEAGRIADALRRNNNNRLKAAAELGISRMTLYKKLHRFGWVDQSF